MSNDVIKVPTWKAAWAYLKKHSNGHGRILDKTGKLIRTCRCTHMERHPTVQVTGDIEFVKDELGLEWPKDIEAMDKSQDKTASLYAPRMRYADVVAYMKRTL